MRVLTRLITVAAFIVSYIALHLVVTAGIDLREREHFHDAPAHAATFVRALGPAADGNAAARDAVRAEEAWFHEGRRVRDSWSLVSLASMSALDGDAPGARPFLDDLDARIQQDQAQYDQDFQASGRVASYWVLASALLVALVLWLRHRRRRGVADVVELVRRFVPERPWWRRPVFLTLSGLGYMLLVPGFFAAIVAMQGRQLSVPARLISGLAGALAVAVGGLVLHLTRRRTARGAAPALLADGRRPVLYLRSFVDDQASAEIDAPPGIESALFSIHSREEQLAGALTAFGPVIAVGRPGEPLPYLGAARFYLTDDQWQAGVRRLMELSQLIVLRLGGGAGLWWEVGQARFTQPPHKLVLLMPGKWGDLGIRLAQHFPAPIKAAAGGDPWTSAVVTFDQAWTPHVVPVAPHNPKKPMNMPAQRVARALQAALAAVGVRKRLMAFRANSRGLASFGRFLLVVIPVAVLLIRVGQLIG